MKSALAITIISLLLALATNAKAAGLRSFEDEPIPIFAKVLNEKLTPPLVQSRRQSANVQTVWIEQKVDHFDDNNNDTWYERILVNDEHHIAGGPLFIYIGGEWEIDDSSVTGGLWYDIAKEHNGSVIYTEHRYFGQSIPTATLTTENLQYQHVKQALADLAHIIDHLRDTEAKYNNSKVVISGCSYSATVTVLFRQLYPDYTVGGWASSAPLQAKVDFSDFMEVVGRVYLELGSQECYDRIENATAHFEDLFANNRTAEAKAYLQLCDSFDPNDQQDIWTLFSTYANSFANLVQKQKPGDVAKYCKMLKEYDEDDALAYANFVYFMLHYPKCVNAHYKNTVNYYKWSMNNYDGTGLAWFYLTCKQFGWYQSSASVNQPFGSSFPVNLNLDTCKDVFGENFGEDDIDLNIALTNNEFGGKEAAVENTYLTHGGLDGWHLVGAGVEQGAVIIPQASHCPDQESISDSDSHALKKSKKRLAKLVRKWLE